MSTHTRAEIKAALARYRDHQLSLTLLAIFQVAAEEYPDELRKALGQVLHLGPILETNQRTEAAVQQTWVMMEHIREQALEYRREVERLSAHVEALRYEAERLSNYLADWYGREQPQQARTP